MTVSAFDITFVTVIVTLVQCAPQRGEIVSPDQIVVLLRSGCKNRHTNYEVCADSVPC